MAPVSGRRHSFSRNERLKGRGEISAVFARGRKVSGPGGNLFFLDNGSGLNRIAFTLVRKYGTAVQRNRSRRLSREAYRLLKNRVRQGYDLVLLIYPGNDEWGLRIRQLETLLSRAGLLSDGA